jgi:hypothetical protein
MNSTCALQSKNTLVDVREFEPLTPCLQIQKANLDDIKKREKE